MKIWRFRMINNSEKRVADAVGDDYGVTREKAINRDALDYTFGDDAAKRIVEQLNGNDEIDAADFTILLEQIDVAE
jgi:hypothetical protein